MQIITAAVTVILAALAGYFSLILTSPTEVLVGPVRVEFSLKPSWQGKSVVELPPAGSLEANTHIAPAAAVYSLKEITVTEIEELTDAGSPSRQAMVNWREPVSSELNSFLIRAGALAAVAGGLVAALLRRRWRWALAGAAVGLASAALVAGAAYATYDTSGFREPRFSGNLAYAPEIFDFSQQTLANLDAYENRIPEIAESLRLTVNELHGLPADAPGDDAIRVLHISDMHASTAAAGLVKTVADLYRVDLIVDSGDSTELGTTFEARYLSTYLPLPPPYVWVAGNHDTPTITGAMNEFPGVTVLDDGFVTVAGITMGGFADIASAGPGVEPADDRQLAEAAKKIARKVDEQKPAPFMIAVHDPKMAGQLAGRVPVVLHGHTHKESIAVRDGTVFMDAGSTGAGGLRGFEGNSESPSTLHVLYILREPMKLVAADTVTIYGFSQEFSVARRVFGEGEGGFDGLEEEAAVALRSSFP